MSTVLLPLLETLLIVTSLSMDAFVSALAYGTSSIKIPISSVCVISLICSVIFAISLTLGDVISSYLSAETTKALCFLILIVLGTIKIFDSAIKAFIRRHSSFNKKIRFSALNLKFILSIYADPEKADSDCSRTLSPGEAAFLAIALSFDGIAVGFGTGMTEHSPWLLLLFSFVANTAGVLLGCWIGNRLTRKINLNLDWLSGFFLIVLAFIKIF